MEIWIDVKTEYNEYLLFSYNYDCEWIYCWFNEKIPDLPEKIKYVPEIEIENDIMNMFFHDCLDIMLNPMKYVREHPDTIVPSNIKHLNLIVYRIQNRSAKIIRKVNENYQDMLGESKFYLGVELEEYKGK